MPTWVLGPRALSMGWVYVSTSALSTKVSKLQNKLRVTKHFSSGILTKWCMGDPYDANRISCECQLPGWSVLGRACGFRFVNFGGFDQSSQFDELTKNFWFWRNRAWVIIMMRIEYPVSVSSLGEAVWPGRGFIFVNLVDLINPASLTNWRKIFDFDEIVHGWSLWWE